MPVRSLSPLKYAHPCINVADTLVLNSCRRSRRAAYQHGNRRGCLRGTRESVLNEIGLWIKDFSKSPVFWLNGLAGTGKSTIAQTVAERVFADGHLGAVEQTRGQRQTGRNDLPGKGERVANGW